ncbi:hypothetical protein [Rhizobium laguerreae]|uniref:hypothetical protein n=1 Tax=Rhizobium laguerreae TaxID=1076926 RepID=UPI001FEB337D|nr:hypothetical protein [Rhizobium laguerreae]
MSERFSISDGIRTLFPQGYLHYAGYQSMMKPEKLKKTKLHSSFVHPRCQAVDLFAIAAFLLHRSGGYHHISPSVEGAASSRSLAITSQERERWQAAGSEWRGDAQAELPPPPAELKAAWMELMRYARNPLFLSNANRAKPRPWWRATMALLAIADEAARDLGFELGKKKTAQAAMSEIAMRDSIRRGKPDFRVIDDRPKLELNEEKITLLIRSALLDDATNISEKLGALQARISVDDENDVWISLEDDLWPHDKSRFRR